jgi:hypothetical protein
MRATMRASDVAASRSELSPFTTPRPIASVRAATSSGDCSSPGGGIEGEIELTLDRRACATELKFSPEIVMGLRSFTPSMPPYYRFLLSLPTPWRASAAKKSLVTIACANRCDIVFPGSS